MLLAVPPYFRVLITLHSFMCIRSATRTSNLAHLPGKCFSSEDSHTEISKRFAWNALSRWHFISASLHLLYLHMFIVQNQKYYCIFYDFVNGRIYPYQNVRFQFTHFSATLRSISLISLFYHIHTKRSTSPLFSDDWCNFQYFASIIKSGSALSEPFLRRVCTYRF